MPLDHKIRFVVYLLGDLPEEDRERLEQEYFADEDVWQAVCAAEDELIEAYVRGRLSPEQKSKFESHILVSPAKQRRVEVQRMLIDSARRAEFPETQGDAPALPASRRVTPWAPALAAAAALVLAAGLLFVMFQNRALRSQLGQAQAAQQEQQRQIDTLHRQIAALVASPLEGGAPVEASTLPTISLLLEPGLQRRGIGDTANVVPLPSVPAEILLAFDLRNDQAAAYEMVIQTPEGKEIHQTGELKSRPSRKGGRVVAVNLSSRLLPRGDYVASLFGIDARGRRAKVDSYSFSVLGPS